MSAHVSPTVFRRLLVSSCLLASFGAAGDIRAAVTPDVVDQAVKELDLPHDQKQGATQIVNRYRLSETQAYDRMLTQMSSTLTADQFQALKRSMATAPAGADTAPQPEQMANGSTRVTVIITGGYDTDPRDHGRPVALVAAALGVPDDVFRKAFSSVHPAGPGQQPQEADVRQNKRVLLDALGPYGVDDDRLNEVSNYYRYSRSRDRMWRLATATVDAVIKDGVVTGFVVTNAGAGYSSPPTIAVPGHPEVKSVATLKFGIDLKTNGSIQSVTPAPDSQLKSAE